MAGGVAELLTNTTLKYLQRALPPPSTAHLELVT